MPVVEVYVRQPSSDPEWRLEILHLEEQVQRVDGEDQAACLIRLELARRGFACSTLSNEEFAVLRREVSPCCHQTLYYTLSGRTIESMPMVDGFMLPPDVAGLVRRCRDEWRMDELLLYRSTHPTVGWALLARKGKLNFLLARWNENGEELFSIYKIAAERRSGERRRNLWNNSAALLAVLLGLCAISFVLF
ncbi:MAG: hypothetical protein Q8R13_03270 [bacterium]|nr:hypothetical protein [bacterium]MDZ4295763.1 hypothetical protein [Patescibacteria group bacterium]